MYTVQYTRLMNTECTYLSITFYFIIIFFYGVYFYFKTLEIPIKCSSVLYILILMSLPIPFSE